MRLRVLVTALMLIFATGTASAAECMQDNQADQIAEGRLSLGKFEDAAGNPEQAFILTLPVPICLDSDDAESAVQGTATIHIFSMDESIRASIESFVGKDVHVRGTPFSAHTAHHHAPIVMDVSEIDAI
jgi:Domain of unknown function (DUF4431)